MQMVEHGGFYRTSDQTWVKLERIQFVGACNPPTDPGRKPLTHRYKFRTYPYQPLLFQKKHCRIYRRIKSDYKLVLSFSF